MKKAWMATVLFGLSVLWVPGLVAQLTPEELAQQAPMGGLLKTADVGTSQRQLSGEGAVTNPWVLTLRRAIATHRGPV